MVMEVGLVCLIGMLVGDEMGEGGKECVEEGFTDDFGISDFGGGDLGMGFDENLLFD